MESQKVITAMGRHAKMFRHSHECRKLATVVVFWRFAPPHSLSLSLSFYFPLSNSPSSQTNEIKFPVSFELKRAVDFLAFPTC